MANLARVSYRLLRNVSSRKSGRIPERRLTNGQQIGMIPRLSMRDPRSIVLANSAQAAKRARQAEKRRQHNASQRSEMRTHVKNVEKAIARGNQEKAQAAYKQAVPIIDRMADKGQVHKNTAARQKSRLNAHIRAL